MSFQMSNIANNLHLNENGIYTTGNFQSISYPNKGNELCFLLEDDSFWFQHRSRMITEAVKHFYTESIFYDIGGGNGFVTKSLQNQKINALLIEPGKEGIANAKQRGVQNIINGNFEDINFKTNVVKTVGLFDVLEHVENENNFLKKISLAMSKDALLFITVPAFKFLWSNGDLQAGHYSRYNLKSLEQLLKDNGFKVLRKSYLFSVLVLPIFLLRTIPSLFKQAKSNINFEKHQNIHQPKSFVRKIINTILKRELHQFKKEEISNWEAVVWLLRSLLKEYVNRKVANCKDFKTINS